MSSALTTAPSSSRQIVPSLQACWQSGRRRVRKPSGGGAGARGRACACGGRMPVPEPSARMPAQTHMDIATHLLRLAAAGVASPWEGRIGLLNATTGRFTPRDQLQQPPENGSPAAGCVLGGPGWVPQTRPCNSIGLVVMPCGMGCMYIDAGQGVTSRGDPSFTPPLHHPSICIDTPVPGAPAHTCRHRARHLLPSCLVLSSEPHPFPAPPPLCQPKPFSAPPPLRLPVTRFFDALAPGPLFVGMPSMDAICSHVAQSSGLAEVRTDIRVRACVLQGPVG